MYTKQIPYKNFKKEPRTKTVQFNLEVREIIPLMTEFKLIFDWQESLKGQELRVLDTEEVKDFYNAVEAVLLAAWGEMSEDGEHFRKGGRYEFEESKLFAAVMDEFLSDPQMANALIAGVMPEGMEEMIKKSEGNMEKAANDPNVSADIQAQIRALQAQLPAAPAVEGATS